MTNRNGAQIGDDVRVVTINNRTTADNIGRVGKFIRDDQDSSPFLVTFDGKGYVETDDYCFATEIEPVTPGESRTVAVDDVLRVLEDVLATFTARGRLWHDEKSEIRAKFADIGIKGKHTLTVEFKIDAPVDLDLDTVSEKITTALNADSELSNIQDLVVEEL